MVIYISAGHYPESQGACYNGTCEFPVADRIQEILDPLVKYPNFVAVPDGTLASKVKWVNERITENDIYLDLHLNTSKGAMIFRSTLKNESISSKICKIYSDVTGITNLGSRPDYMSQHKSLYVCQYTKYLNGYVFELGSIKDDDELKIIKNKAIQAFIAIYCEFIPLDMKDVLRAKLGQLRYAMMNGSERAKISFYKVLEKLKNLI